MDPEIEVRPCLDYRVAVRDHLREGPEPLAKLVDYATAQLRARTWMGVFGGPLPGGKEAMDIVHGIIMPLLKSDTPIGPTKDIGVEAWLMGRVRSTISNLVRSYENKRRNRRGTNDGDEEVVEDEMDSYAGVERGTSTVEQQELEAELEPLLLDFLTFIESDPTLTKLMECLIDGETKREVIAQKLGISPAEVTNATKRLDRKKSEFAKANADRNPFRQ
jgi:Trp operon repressor